MSERPPAAPQGDHPTTPLPPGEGPPPGTPSGGPPPGGPPAGGPYPGGGSPPGGLPAGGPYPGGGSPATATVTAPLPGGGPRPGTGRRLVRRSDDRVIAGVASGIADHLGIQPWVVRIGFIVLVPFGGTGALAYLLAWLLVPSAATGQSLAASVVRQPSGLRTYLGVGLILLAVVILASAFSEPAVIWAIALIAFGIFLFRQEPEQPDPRPAPTPGPAPGGPAGTTVPGAAVATTVPAAATTTEPLTRPAVPGSDTATLPAPPAWPPPPPDPAAAWGAPPPRAPRPRPFLAPLTFAVALIVTGLALVLNNLNVLDLSVGQVLAVFLTVLGGGLLVGTWWGRAWGLIPVGLLAVPVVALAALAGPVPVEGGVADRLFQPRTPAEVLPSYRLAGGELILDLSNVRFGPDQPPIEASVAGGRLLVVVPDEVTARLRGRVGIGSVDLLGHEDTGAQVDSTVNEPPAKPPARGATAPTVRLDLMAGYGVIEVRRASDPRPFHDVGRFDGSFPQPNAPPPTIPSEEP